MRHHAPDHTPDQSPDSSSEVPDAKREVPYSDPVSSAELERLSREAAGLRESGRRMIEGNVPKKLKQAHSAGQSWSRYAGLGIQFAAALALFTLAGVWADGKFGTEPWLTVLGAALGMTGGMYSIVAAVARMSKAEQRAKNEQQRRGTQA